MPFSHFYYLLISILPFLVSFSFSFHPRLSFYKTWRYSLPAIALTAALAIASDIMFTRAGIWGTNTDYITGISFLYLPIEDVLFFLGISYTLLFCYHSISQLWPNEQLSARAQQFITDVLLFGLLATAAFHRDHQYTFIIFLSTGFLILILRRFVKPDYLGKFYQAFGITIIPFLLIDSIRAGAGLGSAMVWYNDQQNVGIRLGTLPLENIVYGLFLMLLSVVIFEYLAAKKKVAP